MPDFVEEECPCGRVWRGRKGCAFSCDVCYPLDEDAFERWEERRVRPAVDQ